MDNVSCEALFLNNMSDFLPLIKSDMVPKQQGNTTVAAYLSGGESCQSTNVTGEFLLTVFRNESENRPWVEGFLTSSRRPRSAFITL